VRKNHGKSAISRDAIADGLVLSVSIMSDAMIFHSNPL
jgi:hypothetical protein